MAQIKARQPIMPRDEQQLHVIVAEVVQLPHEAGVQELSRWGFNPSSLVQLQQDSSVQHACASSTHAYAGIMPSAQMYQLTSNQDACVQHACASFTHAYASIMPSAQLYQLTSSA